MPFTISVVSAAPSDELTAAIDAMHTAAKTAGRRLHRCAPGETPDDRTTLGHGSDSLGHLHEGLTTGKWRAEAGDILIVDNTAAADPAKLADIAEHAIEQQARLILLDTTAPTWPPQPGAAILQLLRTDLPWAITAGQGPATSDKLSPAASNAPDLQPVLTQAERLHPTMLTGELSAALTKRDETRRDHRRAFDAFQASSWMRARAQSQERTREHGHDIDP